MKKIVFTVLFALLCAVGIWAQETPSTKQPVQRELLKTEVYKVWVNDGDYRTWYLWGVTDSTVTLGTSAYNPKENAKTIPVEKLKWVKTRMSGAIGIGIVSGLGLAGFLGYAIGYSQGEEDDCIFCISAHTMGKLIGILSAPVGALVGGIIGSSIKTITINGSRATLAAEKERLKRYERWK